jgi:YVTN family beta-propeller protein
VGALAYDPAKGEIFAANFLNNTVSVISDSSNSLVATVKVGAEPVALAYDPARGEVFVANNNASSVSVISDTNNTVVATVTASPNPQSIAYDSGRGEIFVNGFYGCLSSCVSRQPTISVISDTRNNVIATINYGAYGAHQEPGGLAYDSAKGEVFAVDTNGTVAVISDMNNTIAANIDVVNNSGRAYPALLAGAAYDPSKGDVFVTGYGYNDTGNTVYVISDATNSVVANVTVGKGPPYAIAYDSGKGEVYVANYNASTVSVISDTSDAVVATLPVGTAPLSLTYDPAKAEVFVGCVRDGIISIISDTNSAVTSTAPEFPAKGLLPVTLLLLSLCGLLFRGKIPRKSRSRSE